jgi:hypothetical protein
MGILDHMKTLLLVSMVLGLVGCSVAGELAGSIGEPLACATPDGFAQIDCSGACSDAPEYVPDSCFSCEAEIVVGQNWSTAVTVAEPCDADGTFFKFVVPPNRRARFFTSGEQLAFRVLDGSSDMVSPDLEYENRTGQMVTVVAFGASSGDWLAAETIE